MVRHLIVRGGLVASDVELEPRVPARRPPAKSWLYRGEVELPAGAERVAVVVEAPDGRRWGGTVAGIFEAERPAAGGYDVASGLLPGPKTVNLLRPRGAMLTGDVRLQAVAEPSVARVEFYVDGRRRETASQPPFAAVVDFGRLPVARRVEAVGYDAGGAEVGRDALLLNTGGGRLRVRITEPEGPKAVGAVDVTVDVEVPEGEPLDRVDLYWRDQRVATLFQPPFRHRLRIPAGAAEGYLRAVARLADGTQAEDVVYLNGPLAGERIDVNLTELYVVVTDRDGHPVRDLKRDDFEVREEGDVQTIDTFSDAGDLPITVGLAIDSSASMFVKLPEVQKAAAEFLAELHAGRDRAFLVDFDDDVRLAAVPPATSPRCATPASAWSPTGAPRCGRPSSTRWCRSRERRAARRWWSTRTAPTRTRPSRSATRSTSRARSACRSTSSSPTTRRCAPAASPSASRRWAGACGGSPRRSAAGCGWCAAATT